jgi:hypothetical protein
MPRALALVVASVLYARVGVADAEAARLCAVPFMVLVLLASLIYRPDGRGNDRA